MRPIPNPIEKQSLGDEKKKKTEVQHKLITSTPRPNTVTLKKELKLIVNRSETEPVMSTSIKIEPTDSARTTVYRLGTKRIAKRRETLLM